MSRMEFDSVTFDYIKHKTDKSVLVTIDDDDKWIPLATIAMDDLEELVVGETEVTVRIHTWFIDKEGLSK